MREVNKGFIKLVMFILKYWVFLLLLFLLFFVGVEGCEVVVWVVVVVFFLELLGMYW